MTSVGCAHDVNNSFGYASGSGSARSSGILAARNGFHDTQDDFRRALELRYNKMAANNDDVPTTTTEPEQLPVLSFEQEVRALNDEIRKIQLGCQQIIETQRLTEQQNAPSSPQGSRASPTRVVPRMGTKCDYPGSRSPELNSRNLPGCSANPNIILPLDSNDVITSTPQLRSHKVHPQDSHACDVKTFAANPCDVANIDYCEDDVSAMTKSESSSSVHQLTQTPCSAAAVTSSTLQDLYSKYVDVMYTNEENLEHTMRLQQRLFQQKLQQQQQQQSNTSPVLNTNCHETKDSQKSDKTQKNHSNTNQKHSSAASGVEKDVTNGNQSASSVQMEWVVKRRADGSRYITRRPMRSKMLRERARQISEERCGVTTDDDAMSELKVGRYWSKADRKRHLEKAREQRRRREQAQKVPTRGAASQQVRIASELAQRKMMKQKNKRVLDDFTSIQEVLTHGSRHVDPNNPTPLLSVTTV